MFHIKYSIRGMGRVKNRNYTSLPNAAARTSLQGPPTACREPAGREYPSAPFFHNGLARFLLGSTQTTRTGSRYGRQYTGNPVLPFRLARETQGSQERSFDMGASDFLQKPIIDNGFSVHRTRPRGLPFEKDPGEYRNYI